MYFIVSLLKFIYKILRLKKKKNNNKHALHHITQKQRNLSPSQSYRTSSRTDRVAHRKAVSEINKQKHPKQTKSTTPDNIKKISGQKDIKMTPSLSAPEPEHGGNSQIGSIQSVAPRLKQVTASILTVLSLIIWVHLYNIKYCPSNKMRNMCASILFVCF